VLPLERELDQMMFVQSKKLLVQVQVAQVTQVLAAQRLILDTTLVDSWPVQVQATFVAMEHAN
jgi:hypothetical protein